MAASSGIRNSTSVPEPGRGAHGHPPAQILDPPFHALQEAELPPAPERPPRRRTPRHRRDDDDQPLLPLPGEHDGMGGPRVLDQRSRGLGDRRRHLVDLVLGEPDRPQRRHRHRHLPEGSGAGVEGDPEGGPFLRGSSGSYWMRARSARSCRAVMSARRNTSRAGTEASAPSSRHGHGRRWWFELIPKAPGASR
jgi:hypothetical protein